MNLAYRYWEKINWFPDYYACLDIKMNHNFSDDIFSLVVLHTNTLFLLRKNCGIPPFPNVLYLEDLIELNSLSYLSPWITTGSLSLVWAVLLGFKNIHLYGIDLVAVEIIPEAKQIDDETLVIHSQPVNNPNYFISDYLRLGERYFKPNLSNQYHLKCWFIAKHFAHSRDVKVFNCSPKSRLGIFPFLEN